MRRNRDTGPARRWLADVSRRLGGAPRHRRRTLTELRDHLTDSAARLVEAGVDADAAERRAVAAMGDPREVALGFTNAHPTPFTRLGGALLVLAAVLSFANEGLRDSVPHIVVSMVLLPGIVAIHLRQRRHLRRLGRLAAGTFVLGLGLTVLVVIWLFNLPPNVGFGGLAVLGLVFWTTGMMAVAGLLYVVATIRARVIRTPYTVLAPFLMVVGIQGGEFDGFAVVPALAVAGATVWLGWRMCTEPGSADRHPGLLAA